MKTWNFPGRKEARRERAYERLVILLAYYGAQAPYNSYMAQKEEETNQLLKRVAAKLDPNASAIRTKKRRLARRRAVIG